MDDNPFQASQVTQHRVEGAEPVPTAPTQGARLPQPSNLGRKGSKPGEYLPVHLAWGFGSLAGLCGAIVLLILGVDHGLTMLDHRFTQPVVFLLLVLGPIAGVVLTAVLGVLDKTSRTTLIVLFVMVFILLLSPGIFGIASLIPIIIFTIVGAFFLSVATGYAHFDRRTYLMAIVISFLSAPLFSLVSITLLILAIVETMSFPQARHNTGKHPRRLLPYPFFNTKSLLINIPVTLVLYPSIALFGLREYLDPFLSPFF